MNLERVAIIGAGPVGRRLASLSCGAGFITTLEDVLPSKLRTAQAEMEEMSPRGAGDLLRYASSVADAVRDADLVLDSLPDELESKLEIFSMVDRMAPPHTVLMTPTEVHSIADLASCTYRGDRCFSFVLSGDGRVLIVQTLGTSADARQVVTTFWTRAGFGVEMVVDPAVLPDPTLR